MLAIVVFAELGALAAVAYLVLSSVVVGLYQHFVVRLVVRSVPEDDSR